MQLSYADAYGGWIVQIYDRIAENEQTYTNRPLFVRKGN